MFSAIWNWLKKAGMSFWNAIKRLVYAIVSFFKHIVEYFKKLMLNPKKAKPFIMDMRKMKDMLVNAPVRNAGIFEGVYNTETDEIEHSRIIESDKIDEQTREILGNDTLVILS